jgi:hypothetical protein
MARPRALALCALAVLGLALAMVAKPAPLGAAAVVALPAPAGSEWQVLAGYNTVTHSAVDGGDPYAVDLQRLDAPTEGSPVLAPFAGTVSYTSSSCLSVRDGRGTVVLLCHVFPYAGIRGRTVAQGQPLATVAPPGQANNNGTAHIHMALSQSSGGRTGANIPFSGEYALEGRELPATGAPNAYYGERFVSSNALRSSVDAGPDQRVRPGAQVTLTAAPSDPAALVGWSQVGGPAVQLTLRGAVATFTAPSGNATLQFQAEAFDAAQRLSRDTVTVEVSSTIPISAPVSTSGSARLISGSIPAAGGFGLVVFSGGSADALLAASGCPRQTAAFWVTSGGRFVVFIPGTTVVAVNAGWDALYPSGLPAGAAILGKCR